mgnify:FL=1|tara:strand:+ start:1156 stop:1353 length:198 start_codon:yes stop_codon:yes gene_type:complete
MIDTIKKYFEEFDVEDNIHWIIMAIAVLGICIALIGKYKAQEYVKNNAEINQLLDESATLKNDTL